MTNQQPQMEIRDVEGTTTPFTGSVGTTFANVPAVAGNDIEEFSIRCRVDQVSATRLEFSFDGGTNWFRLRVGEFFSEEPRRGIKQIQVRAAGTGITTCFYELTMNRSPVPLS